MVETFQRWKLSQREEVRPLRVCPWSTHHGHHVLLLSQLPDYPRESSLSLQWYTASWQVQVRQSHWITGECATLWAKANPFFLQVSYCRYLYDGKLTSISSSSNCVYSWHLTLHFFKYPSCTYTCWISFSEGLFFNVKLL